MVWIAEEADGKGIRERVSVIEEKSGFRFVWIEYF